MSGSGFVAETEFNNDSSNATEFTCNVDKMLLSNDNLTNKTFWKITDDQVIGATIAGVLILIFFSVGTIWNLFIIITYLVKNQLLKEPGNIFLFNAAITDFLICITIMIFSYVTAFGREFLFGNSDITRCIVCDMSGFFLMFLILVSLHLLSALSVDRFILLSRPLRYKRLMNRWKALLICLIVYAICFVLAILPLVGLGEIEFNARFASCVPRFTPSRNLYYVVLIAVESLIPIIVLAITNVWTYRIVSKFLKRNFRRRSTFRRRDREGKENGSVDEGAKHQKQQAQLVKVFGALFIANIVSYTPTILTIFVFAFLSIIGKENVIPSAIYILGFVSFLMNPVLHPIIESFFVKDLRYQVTRAKRGLRRAGTLIIRQTTQLISSKALDEANKKMDEVEGAQQTTTRQIKFLGGDKLKQPNGRVADDSMATEMESMPNSRSTSPQNVTTETMDSHSGKDSTKVNNIEEGNSVDNTASKMLNKGRRSVTFQESTFNETLDSTHANPPNGKSALTDSSILKEIAEVFGEGSCSEEDLSEHISRKSPPPV